MTLPAWARRRDDRLELAIKVVPGASRNRIVGSLGERLKIQVAAAPEHGRANAALCELLAAWLGCAASDLVLVNGAGGPLKTVRCPPGVSLPTQPLVG